LQLYAEPTDDAVTSRTEKDSSEFTTTEIESYGIGGQSRVTQ